MSGSKLTPDALSARIKNAGDLTKTSEETLKACAIITHGGMMQGFQNETAPSGKKWDRLAHPRVMGGNRVLQDRGLLKNSVQARATVNGIVASAAHPAANVHQYGATIRPKRAKRLSIPLTKEGKRAGSPRRFPRKLFVVGGRNDKLFLAEQQRGQLLRHYILVKQVVIAAREFVGFSEETLTKIEALLALRCMQRIVRVFDQSARD